MRTVVTTTGSIVWERVRGKPLIFPTARTTTEYTTQQQSVVGLGEKGEAKEEAAHGKQQTRFFFATRF